MENEANLEQAPAENPKEDKPIFVERQRFTNWILWMGLISMAVASWFWFISMILEMTNPSLVPSMSPPWLVLLVWLAVGISLPFIIYLMRFDLRIENDHIIYRYFPFQKKYQRLPIKNVSNYKIVRYDPLGDYGGWGIRKRKHNIGFITPSDRGVIVLVDQSTHITFGSEKPKDLYLAINQVHRRLYPEKRSEVKNASIGNVKRKMQP